MVTKKRKAKKKAVLAAFGDASPLFAKIRFALEQGKVTKIKAFDPLYILD